MKCFYIIVFLLMPMLLFGFDFISPIEDDYIISSKCGSRMNPLGGSDFHFHRGIDLVGPHNCQIQAIEKGIVVAIEGNHAVYGKLIAIDHGSGVYSLYGHLDKIYVYNGDPVYKGNPIGTQGSTGQATGEHLHFEIIIDPLMILNKQLEVLNAIESFTRRMYSERNY